MKPPPSKSVSATIIRPAETRDLAALTEICRHYVLTSPATFELDPPDRAEMERRFRAIREGGYDYFVAEEAGEIVGYAYATAFRARSTYRFTVEHSVYARRSPAQRHRQPPHGGAYGIERRKGFPPDDRGIGDSANVASIGFRTSLGFADAGVRRAVGYKFGRWLDTVEMRKVLGPGDRAPPEER
jgi:L-amino acid N-acyltransferase YncA